MRGCQTLKPNLEVMGVPPARPAPPVSPAHLLVCVQWGARSIAYDLIPNVSRWIHVRAGGFGVSFMKTLGETAITTEQWQ